MSLIQIDAGKCKKDGLCAEVCPSALIFQQGKELPQVAADMEKFCNACGHCVGICPSGALSLEKMPIEECEPVRRELEPGADTVEQFLKRRRSIREFKQDPLPREILERVIDDARWAPSAVNVQPVRWTAVTKREDVLFLAGQTAEWMRETNNAPIYLAAWEQGRDMILRGAPHLVVACSPADSFWGPMDCSIALTYLELAAQANGLGTCWAGLLVRAAGARPEIGRFLGLEDGQRIYGAVMIGRPKYKYRRIPARNAAKITWL